jgi:hypothetical protein
MPVLDTIRFSRCKIIGAVRAFEKRKSGALTDLRQTRSDIKC